MTERTWDEIRQHAADLWQAQFDDQTPMEAFGHLAAPVRMKQWLRENGFPKGEDTRLSFACSERARGLKKARAMVSDGSPEG